LSLQKQPLNECLLVHEAPFLYAVCQGESSAFSLSERGRKYEPVLPDAQPNANFTAVHEVEKAHPNQKKRSSIRVEGNGATNGVGFLASKQRYEIEGGAGICLICSM
jgi:hypothetical protein